MHSSRRDFLKNAALAAAVLPFAPARAAVRSQRVAVVGAGLAGLVAAYELMRAGHTVSLFEARDRPGGRIRTLHNAFGDGMYVEEGAADFGDGYTLIADYLTQFALPVHTSAGEKAVNEELFYIGGRRYRVPRGTEPDWPYALSPEERRLGIRGLWDKYAQPAQRALAEPFDSRSMSRAARSLDERTVADLVRRQGGSDAAVLLLERDAQGADFEHVSALQDLVWRKFLAHSQNRVSLKGGNDRLPQAFAERLGARVHYGAELRALAQDRSQVRLSISSAGGTEQVLVDRAVIAIPFSVLRHLQLGDAFARHKRMVINQLRYESATRIFLHSGTRFWREGGLDGSARTDLAVGSLRDFSAGQTGVAGILGTEVSGAASRRLAGLSDAERVRLGLENVTRVFPDMQAAYLGGTSVCWDAEPYAQGGWAYYAPGEMNSMFPQVATPDGRIHFAGEHTSSLYLLEGAAQSGVRAAREINAA
jgi:monoamine oxidase